MTVFKTTSRQIPHLPPIKSLDLLRGIAALWVVFYHACLPYVTGHPGSESGIGYPVLLQGQLGVVVFFVVSGYCITAAAIGDLRRGNTLRNFLYHRIRRIYPPYLVACAFAVTFGYMLAFAQQFGSLHITHPRKYTGTWLFWLTNITLVQHEAGSSVLLEVSWTLCYEVAFYLLMGVFFWISQWCGRQRGDLADVQAFLGCVGIVTATSLVWLTAAPTSCVFPLTLWYQFGIGSITFFILNSSRLESDKGLLQYMTLAATLIILALLIDTVLHWKLGGVLGHPGLRSQVGVALLVACMVPTLQLFDESLCKVRLIRPLFFLGTLSYSLYLVHTLVMPFVDVVGRRAGLTGRFYMFNVLMQVSASLGAGWLFFLAVERHFLSSRQKKRVVDEGAISSRDITKMAAAPGHQSGS